MGKLTAVIALGVGYVLGTRAGRERYEQIKQAAASAAQRPEVQKARDRLKTVAGDKLQAGTGRVSQRTAGVTGKLRRGRSTGTGSDSGADTSPSPSSGIGMVDEPSPEAAREQDSPGASGDADGQAGADRLR